MSVPFINNTVTPFNASDSYCSFGHLILYLRLERFSNECRKTKTKVITLANQKDGDNPVNQSKPDVITRSRHKARENVQA